MSAHLSRERMARLDELGPDERDNALQHVRGCLACRTLLAETDPARLFSLLALQEVPQGLLERLSTRVDAVVQDIPRRRSGWSSRVVAAIAASLLLVAGLSAYVLTSRGPSLAPPGQPGVIVAEDGGVPAGRLAPVEGPVVQALGEIELLSPTSAEVVNFNMGDTQVVMIFDEALDL